MVLVRDPDHAGLPARTRAQQQFGVARYQLQDFHEFHAENVGHGRGDLIEQFLQIDLGQRALAQACRGFLLPGARAAARAGVSGGR